MMRRFLATLHARNMEFLRDRSSLGWNVIFPVGTGVRAGDDLLR